MPGPPKKEVLRLLPSELRLLPPGDKAAPGALELQNWRVDQQGVLRSRRGITAEATGFGDPFHTVFRWSDQRYGLTGANLHKGPTLSTYMGNGFSGEPCTMLAYQGLTWIMDRTKPAKTNGDDLFNWSIEPPASAPSVASGAQLTEPAATFDDTEPWDVISNDGVTNKYLIETDDALVSNAGTIATTASSNSIVGTGTAFDVSWIGKQINIFNPTDPIFTQITAVTDATHADVALAPNVTASGIPYEVRNLGSTVTETRQFDASNKTEGTHSLRMVCSPGGKWTARITGLSLDSSIASQQRGDDQFRFQFYASDPGNVTKVAVTFIDSSERFMTAEIQGSAISPARYLWQELSISRGIEGTAGVFGDAVYARLQQQYDAANAAANYAAAALILEQMTARQVALRAQQNGFSGSGGFDWTAIAEIQISVHLTDASDIHLDNAYFIGGVDSSLSGDFQYAVSYDNDFGHESAIGPYSSTVTLDKQGAALTSIPVPTDPQVTAKHIYRIGGGVNAPLRVQTLAPAATSWSDLITIEEQQDNAIPAQIDGDPAPQAWGAIQHLGRIVAWRGSRIFWSETAKPWSFPGAAGTDPAIGGNWIDVGEDGENIVCCTSHRNMLLIYKTKTIWRVIGDPDAAGNDPEPTSAGFGALGIRGVVEAGAVDYFIASEGVFAFNGDDAVKVSQAIDPLFKSDYPALTTASWRTPAAQDTLDTAALGFINGRLYVSYPEAGQSTPNKTLVLDTSTDRWYDHSGGFRCFFYEGQGATLIAGTQDGAVVSLEQGLQDAGGNINLRWRTAYLDQGFPDNNKRYSDIVIEYQTAFGGESPAATLNVSLCLDNGATVISLGTISSASRTTATFTPNVGTDWEGKNFALLIDGDTSKTVLIYAAYAHYEVLPRRGCMFDSDIIDIAGGLLGEVEAVELDIATWADTSLSWGLSTDWPGGALASRQTGSTAISSGRRTVSIPFNAGIEGRRVRWQYKSAVPCPQLFGVRVKVRSKGELIEPGQAWNSGVKDLGELNVFGAVEIVADTNGAIAYSLLTELPGSDMASRDSASLDTSTSALRVPISRILPHATRGKLVQVTLTPGTNILRLFSVRVWARNFDKASGGGAWRWINLYSAPSNVGAADESRWIPLEVRN